MREVISREDARDAGQKHYFTGALCRHGHLRERLVSSKQCVACDIDRQAARRKRPEHKAKIREAGIKRRAKADKVAVAAYLRAWRAQNKDKVQAYQDKWQSENYEAHKESARKSARKYRELHPEVFRLHARARGARVRNATPPWVDRADLRKMYEACPDGYHVDHIVPINGGNICGLHVPANLQYLTPRENSIKGNRWLEGSAHGLVNLSAFHFKPIHANGGKQHER